MLALDEIHKLSGWADRVKANRDRGTRSGMDVRLVVRLGRRYVRLLRRLPGAAPLVGDFPRWRRYVLDSLIETTVSRDVLSLGRIEKPAPLRQLFYLTCELPGQVVAYSRLLGQLNDAGNTTTLASHLRVLEDVWPAGGTPPDELLAE